MNLALCLFCGQFFAHNFPTDGKPAVGACYRVQCLAEAAVRTIFMEKALIADQALSLLTMPKWD